MKLQITQSEQRRAATVVRVIVLLWVAIPLFSPTAEAQQVPYSVQQIADSSRLANYLTKIYPQVPRGVKFAIRQFTEELAQGYNDLADHQRRLLDQEIPLVGKAVRNPEEHALILEKFALQIAYLREKGHQTNYCILVNAAPRANGGQKLYLLDMETEEIFETLCSTAWRGIGFVPDSYTTPIGYFMVKEGRTRPDENNTILGNLTDIFRKLEHQRWLDLAKWLHRVSTQREKAYMLSNQLALKGMNDGSEEVPLNALKDHSKLSQKTFLLDNGNTAFRQIYIHGTNRLEQLGHSLSGGCVRVSNVSSFLLAHIFRKQGEIPMFIDYVKFKEGRDLIPTDIDDILRDMETFDRVATPYRSMSQEAFAENGIVARTLYTNIVKKAAAALLYDPTTRLNISISASVPLPETFMREWLYTAEPNHDFDNKPYRHLFDQEGIYYTDKSSADPAMKMKIGGQQRKSILHARVDGTKNFLVSVLEKELARHEMDYDLVADRITIEFEAVELKTRVGKVVAEGYALAPERQLVLEYLEKLDSLVKQNPEELRANPTFAWIGSYIDQPQQVFEREMGGQLVSNAVTLHDVLLLQAYLLAAGEISMREADWVHGKLIATDDPAFYDIYKKGSPQFYQKLNESGIAHLLGFCNANSQLNARFVIGQSRNTYHSIMGTLHVAEAFFSRYKQASNQLVVTLMPEKVHTPLFVSVK